MEVTKKRKFINVLVILLFSISALIGTVLMFIAVWGDVEATMFDASYNGEENLGTLSCPILITPQDTGEVSAKIRNPADRTVKTSVRLHVSAGFLTKIREESTKIDLDPAESTKVAWTVSPEEAAYGKMVLVRVFLFPSHPIPSKDATCGIFVVNVPLFTGNQITIASILISSIGMVTSAGVWSLNNKPLTKRQKEVLRTFSILAAAIIFGTIANLMGWWLLAAVAIAVTFLTIISGVSELLK